jgi:deoxyinosine 3'endonuclease (endonuclease V)
MEEEDFLDSAPPPGMPPDLLELREKWMAEQMVLARKVSLSDADAGFRMPWDEGKDPKPTIPGATPLVSPSKKSREGEDSARAGPPPLQFVGGLDISFLKDTSIAVASLAVMSFPSLKIVHTLMHHCEMKLPYMAGFLAFREVEPLKRLLEVAKQQFPTEFPQILFIDGNGVLHHRRCGLASHLGVVCDIPCVGSAKKLLAVEGLQRDAVRDAVAKSKQPMVPLIGSSTDTLGYAALTGNSTTQPIFISAGHRISQHSAARLVLMMCKNRVPEPIRQADLLSRRYIKESLGDIAQSRDAVKEVAASAIPAGKGERRESSDDD